MEIKLGEDQINSLNSIKNFIESDKYCYSLVGYAGTGKSTLIKEIINHLEEKWINYILCAPTHKAKVVLERFTNKEGVTLHKLLSLSPNIEILNLDFRELKFNMGPKPLFPYKGVIICDESSMVNDDLFTMLEEKCKQFNCKIIFCGDKAQLRPVNALTHSKVFNLEDKSELKHIYRQSSESGLVDILPVLRNNIISHFSDRVGSEGSLYCFSNVKSFFKESLPYFKKAIRTNDILEAKILAYTNDRVNSLNNKMREVLFGKDSQYQKFELLTAYENLEFNGVKLYNSMDYVIVDDPIKIDINIPHFINLPGFKLNLYDSSSKTSEEILILDKEISSDYLNSLAQLIERTRLEAIDLKMKKSKYSYVKWKEYYEINNSFTTPFNLYYDNRLIRKKSFDYGYASTVHKS